VVDLDNGFYTYVCDIHIGILEGEFAVGTAAMPKPPASPAAKARPKAKPKKKSKRS
jgi:hypothetical protein